ncbi:VOC family protein [Glutamicibacter sp. JL.03c]|uniref:VOC family protein n=1 Tax=Glutamicibacter sp. JL.03c TaxID=2984842 RepID=UPI0021F7F43B|nr:VOC family protein [Glutamicibacter sp. JL.03c]UYQ77474.1 VOC family protein [Glutamicibacter sp. JL.03c]
MIRINHIGLYVQDLERARAFYEQFFNAVAGEKYRNDRTAFESYFLDFDGGPRLELMTRPTVVHRVERPTFGWDHLAISVGSKAEVDRLTELLNSAGYRTVSGPRTTGDGYYESVVPDGEGNLIEITA